MALQAQLIDTNKFMASLEHHCALDRLLKEFILASTPITSEKKNFKNQIYSN